MCSADPDLPEHSKLAARLLYAMMRVFKAESATIGDAGAVAAAIYPQSLTVQSLHVEARVILTLTPTLTLTLTLTRTTSVDG